MVAGACFRLIVRSSFRSQTKIYVARPRRRRSQATAVMAIRLSRKIWAQAGAGGAAADAGPRVPYDFAPAPRGVEIRVVRKLSGRRGCCGRFRGLREFASPCSRSSAEGPQSGHRAGASNPTDAPSHCRFQTFATGMLLKCDCREVCQIAASAAANFVTDLKAFDSRPQRLQSLEALGLRERCGFRDRQMCRPSERRRRSYCRYARQRSALGPTERPASAARSLSRIAA
jgi:hypothetical protein